MFDFDELSLLKGEDYQINDKITIHHPTLNDIYLAGEEKYYSMIQTICATPADFKVQLDDAGVNFQNITDLELFVILGKNIPQEETKILLGDVNLKDMDAVTHIESGEIALYDKKNDIIIDKVVYTLISDFIRKIHGIKKNEEYASNELTRKIMIDIEREEQQRRLLKDEGFKSVLAPYISSVTNCSEGKYDIKTIWDLPIYVFLDSVKRINKIKQSGYMLSGAYGGWVDAKQFNKDDIDWLGELK